MALLYALLQDDDYLRCLSFGKGRWISLISLRKEKGWGHWW